MGVGRIFPGGALEDFSKIFPGGAKSGEIRFFPLESTKTPFLLNISKSRGDKAPLCPPFDAHECSFS